MSSGVSAGGDDYVACGDMLCCRTKYCFDCVCCYWTYIFWYIVLQKRLVRDFETIVARNQRGEILVFGLHLNVAEPAHSLEPVLGLVYMLKVSIFVFWTL